MVGEQEPLTRRLSKRVVYLYNSLRASINLCARIKGKAHRWKRRHGLKTRRRRRKTEKSVLWIHNQKERMRIVWRLKITSFFVDNIL